LRRKLGGPAVPHPLCARASGGRRMGNAAEPVIEVLTELAFVNGLQQIEVW